MVKQLDRIRRALWTVAQPLTRRPAQPAMPVSDLFVWRNSSEWKTSFELIDMPALFAEPGAAPERHAMLYVFDQRGRGILQKRLDVLPYRRQTVELANVIGSDHGEIGTFAVFHSAPPAAVTAMGSYLAERGYVSYRYRDAPVRGYVHGNLDAIALGADARLELLGARGLLPREYRLQHEIQGAVLYELGLVNPTSVTQRCTCQFVSARGGTILDTHTVTVASRGVALIPGRIDGTEPARVIIKSRLVMARPLVFRIRNPSVDVFHG